MPAYFEAGVFSGGERAWHHGGIVVDDPWLTPAQVLTLVPEIGLDVQAMPASYQDPDGTYHPMSDVVANVREDGAYLGAVSPEYQLVQPRKSFDVLSKLTADHQLKIDTAGTCRGGRTMWVLAYLPRDILVGGHESERVVPYICFHNSYDGKRALTIGLGPTRVVCWNTVQAFDNSAQRSWTMRHTGNIDEKLAEASHSLGLMNRYYDEFERLANQLIASPFTVRDMRRLTDRLTAFKPKPDESDRAAENREAAKAAVLSFFLTSPDLSESAAKNTRWAAYNAVAEYSDHERRARASKLGEDAGQVRFRRNLIMPDTTMKDEALKLLTA